jgi:hypothetical protein
MSQKMTRGRLGVVVDGEALPEEKARAFWSRFSEHMEENPGDLAGFARNEGLVSVHPEVRDGQAVLVASHTEEQRPYVSAARKGGGGGGSRAVRTSRGGANGSRGPRKDRERRR